MGPALQQILFGSAFAPGAILAADFLASKYRNGVGSGFTPDFANLPNLTVTRASIGYDVAGTISFPANVARIVPGFGVLVEEARTNLFLNSFAPVTQNVTITAVSHTITVWGTGSVTVAAGTATITNGGVASAGAPRTIGCTVAGTISVTVTGSPSIVQVEAGAFGTSPVPTLGATVTRQPDIVSFSGLTLPANGTFFAQFLQPTSSVSTTRILDSGAGVTPLVLTLPTRVSAYNGVRQLDGPSFSAAVGAVIKAANAYSASSTAITAQGAAPVTDANSVGTMAGLKLGGDGTGTDYLNGYLQKVILYARTYSSAELIALTT